MRILGYIEHDYIKMTVFEDNGKNILQCEDGLCQLTYKFRQSDLISDLDSIQRVVDEKLSREIENQLKSMHQIKKSAIDRVMQDIEDEFDTII